MGRNKSSPGNPPLQLASIGLYQRLVLRLPLDQDPFIFRPLSSHCNFLVTLQLLEYETNCDPYLLAYLPPRFDFTLRPFLSILIPEVEKSSLYPQDQLITQHSFDTQDGLRYPLHPKTRYRHLYSLSDRH